jgi:hypothetical protein
MFHLDVSKVDLVLHMLQWLYTYISSVSSVFKRMLHMFYLNVSKVDRMLHGVVAESGLPQGFGSYLAPSSRGAPRPFFSYPSPPFPSLHLAMAV